MVPCAPATVLIFRQARRVVHFVLVSFFIILPASAFAQEERALEKSTVEKARQEAAAKQQASPEPLKTDEKKSEEEKGDEEKKPADPMSSPTFNGLKLRAIGRPSRLVELSGLLLTQTMRRAISSPLLRVEFG